MNISINYNYNILFCISSTDIESVKRACEVMKVRFSNVIFSNVFTVNKDDSVKYHQLASFYYMDDEVDLNNIVDKYNSSFLDVTFELILIGTSPIADIFTRSYFKPMLLDFDVNLTYYLDYHGYFSNM